MKPHAEKPPLAPLRVGRYLLHTPLASGGMATIHLGRAIDSTGAQGILAIKRLHVHLASDPEFTSMFLDEAHLTQQIRHENVVPTLETFTADGEVFLVMPCVLGDSLARLLRTYAPPAFNVVARVVCDALHGLHAAHTATTNDGAPLHIVHRDVSPQNILVDTNGVAKIIDFGVAKARGRIQHTHEGQVKGKLAYMSPEQLLGEEVTPQSDIYAVGIVLWEFLTGKRLFKADNEGATVTRILAGQITRPKDIWAKQALHTISMLESGELTNLDRITMRALSREPRDRYASAREMALELEKSVDLASREEVASWVKEAARDLLAARMEAISEIASGVYDMTPAFEEPAPSSNLGVLLPVIVADLADVNARDVLAKVATARGTVLVPLVAAPVDRGEHVLEVHIPGEGEPTLFHATPTGPPEQRGFPLRLSPFGVHQDAPHGAQESPTFQVEARTFTTQALSNEHTRDLTSGQYPDHAPVSITGRVLGDGKLRIEANVGAGGGGSVYRARHLVLERPVAVKVLHDSARHDVEFCARFHAEALAASKLDHKNLVRVIDFGQEPDGLLYLTMEYLDGVSLRDVLSRERRLPVLRALPIMLQVCAGISHAHSRGVVHRDIKPSNVMLVPTKDDDGQELELVKVCDFGIAVERADTREAIPIAGTPQYMSPEQCRGGEVDERSDVYSSGVMLYQIVTGSLPFRGKGDADFLRMHLATTPTPPSNHFPGIHPQLEQIILKTLAKSPSNRFASMRELRDVLKEQLNERLRDSVSKNNSITPPPASNVAPKGSRVPTIDEEGDALASELARSPSISLQQFALERGNQAEFARKTERLERAVLVLANRSDAMTLGHVVRVVTAIHDEAIRATPQTPATHSAHARTQRVLHTIADPGTLAPIASSLLACDRTDASDALLALLRWAQVAGALALCRARALREDDAARARFVAAMARLGASSGPAVRASLGQLLPRADGSVSDEAFALDLIRSVPNARDDAMGSVIAPYVRASSPELARAAMNTMVIVWGERATPVLLATLQSPDESLRIAAISGLKTLRAIDAFAARKIASIMQSTPAPSKELLAACAEALALTGGSGAPV